MSSPKRYDLFVQTGVELEDAFLSDCENGDWVKFADYERLREALEKYGRHLAGCQYCHESQPSFACECGLLEALTPAAPCATTSSEIVAARKEKA